MEKDVVDINEDCGDMGTDDDTAIESVDAETAIELPGDEAKSAESKQRAVGRAFLESHDGGFCMGSNFLQMNYLRRGQTFGSPPGMIMYMRVMKSYEE